MAANLVIGVDVGGTKFLAGLVDRDGNVHRTVERPASQTSQDSVLDEMSALVRELLSPDVVAVGLGVPARVDQRTGTVLGAVNLPITEVVLAAEMEKRLGLPVGVENDANAAAYAEFRLGAGRHVERLVMLTLGTGVGGGVVLDGTLYRGWAELGHVVIVEDGEPCHGNCSGPRARRGVLLRSRQSTVSRARSSARTARRASSSHRSTPRSTRSVIISASRSVPSSTSSIPSSS